MHGSKVMRAQAEDLMRKKFVDSENFLALTPEDKGTLLQELREHQIQLEMQNEELRNAQLALEELRARYADLYDFAPVGYCSISDNGGMIIDANLMLTKLAGVARAALIGKPFARFIHHADQDRFFVLKRRMLAVQAQDLQSAEPSHSIELRLIASDGNAIWVRLMAARTLSLGPQQLRIVVTDISANKQVESELASSERRLRTIIETEPECVKLLDADGALLEMNAAGLNMVEAQTFQQIENHCVYSLVDEAHRAGFRALTERVFRGETGIFEFQITGLKGTRRWLETHASPLRDDTGRITASLGITRDVSARKLAEAARHLSDVALKSISQGVIITGADQRIVSANSAFCAITGYSAAEILGRKCKFLQGPETDPQTVAAIRSALQNGIEFAGEILNYRKIGTAFWNELTISPVFEAQGTVSHFIGVTRDVTTRRLIEKANQETTMQLRLVIHGGDIGYWDWDIPSNGLAVNDRWYTMLGLDPLGPPPGIDLWHSLVHPEDTHKLALLFESVILNPHGISGEAEIRARHRAGHYVWILDRFSVVDRAKDGTPLRVVGTHLDITERIRAEAAQREANSALRSSEELLRNIIDSNVSHIFAFDMEHRFTLANALMAQDFGQSPNEIIGKTLHQVLPPEVADALLAVNRQIVASGESQALEEIIPDSSGAAVRIMSSMKFPLRNTRGEIIGVGGVATDITARKRADEEIQRQLHELQRWQEVFLGREDRVLGLKREVNELLTQLKQPPRYASPDAP